MCIRDSSTAMGYDTEASGIYSTAMGFYTQASEIYSTAMGFYTEASGRYSTAMGNGSHATGIGELYNSGNVKGLSFVSTSDKRVKQNISPFTGALSKVRLLSPKTYFYNTVEFPRFEAEKNKPQIGFIAQEVEAILPEAVTTGGDIEFASNDKVTGVKGMAYEKLVPLLVKSIQELEARIKTLEDAEWQIQR